MSKIEKNEEKREKRRGERGKKGGGEKRCARFNKKRKVSCDAHPMKERRKGRGLQKGT